MKSLFISFLILFLIVSCTSQKQLANQAMNESHIDSDLDGVPDFKDACPNEPGSPYNLGCPQKTTFSSSFDAALSTDSDLDGVPDEDDECPNEYGSPFNQGCPL